MLAIAANSFNKPSETFIRAHVNMIAPGRTILLCNSGEGSEVLGCPVLSDLRATLPARNIFEKVGNSLRARWHTYINPSLQGADARRVRAFLQRYRPKALLAEFGHNGCLLHQVCKEEGIPLFVHFHGFDATKAIRSKALCRHYRRMFRSSTGVIAPSQFLAARLQRLGCPESKLHTSACGVNIEVFTPSTHHTGMILAVGRFVEKKAPHLTLRAFAKVSHAYPSAHLHMVGDGPLRQMCEREIVSLGLQNNVTLHGTQSHDAVQVLMSQAAIFVQHSIEASDGDCEGLPVSILEAMSSSIPVVSTFHSGIPEAVTHETTGLLVAENDVGAMADSICKLLQNPEIATQMGQAGRLQVENRFTLVHTADRLRKIMNLLD